jgi:hypothetical protein
MAQKIDIAEVCPCTVQHNKLVWVLRLKMPFEKIEFFQTPIFPFLIGKSQRETEYFQGEMVLLLRHLQKGCYNVCLRDVSYFNKIMIANKCFLKSRKVQYMY